MGIGSKDKSDWEDKCQAWARSSELLSYLLVVSRAANKTVIPKESHYGPTFIA